MMNIQPNTSQLPYNLLLIIFTLMLWGCEDFFISEVPHDNIPGSDPKLVVYSYVTAHEPLMQVYVGYSRSYTSRQNGAYVLGDIERVEMSGADKKYHNLVRDVERGLYVIDYSKLSFSPGNTAFLKVTTTKGITAEATCTIPIFDQVPEVEVDEPIILTTNDRETQFRLGWTLKMPPTSVEKYYKVEPYVMIQEFNKSTSISPEETTTFISDTVAYLIPLWLERGQEFFSHVGASQLVRYRAEFWGESIPNGKWNEEEVYQFNYDGIIEYAVINRKRTLYLGLYETDSHYYKFHNSASNYFYYDDDMPFAESVRIYSNIEGGLGVFGGYSKKEINLTDVLNDK